MSSLTCVLSLSIPAAHAWAQDAHGEPAHAEAPEHNRLDLDLDKDVLVFTGPVREDGTIDYVAALNKHYSEGVTNPNNAYRALYLVMRYGENDVDTQACAAAQREMLGITAQELDNSPRFTDWPSFAAQHGIGEDEAVGIEERTLQSPADQQVHPEFAAWLKANEPAFAAAGRAVALPRYWSPLYVEDESGLLINCLLPDLSANRDLARALRARAFLAAQQGDEAAVVEAIRTLRLLALRLSDEPTLIGGLVAISIDAVAADTVKQLLGSRLLSDKALADIDRLWRQRPARVRIAETVMIGERCMGLDAYMQIMAGRISSDGLVGVHGGEGALKRLVGSGAFNINRGLKEFSRYYFQLAKVMMIDHYAYRQRVMGMFETQFEQLLTKSEIFVELGEVRLPNPALLSKDARTDAMTHLLMSILFPALGAAANTETRFLATDRSVPAAIACERYRLKHGKLPTQLDDLVPGLLGAIPTDPFNDEPMHYKRTDTGFIVYAVGPNLEDDDGFENNADRSEGDWVFEVQWRAD